MRQLASTPAQKLRDTICKAGWSREDAAEKLHCTVMSIGRYIAQAEHDDGKAANKQRRSPHGAVVHLAQLLSAVEGL